MTYRSVFIDGVWKEINNQQWEERMQKERENIEFFNKLLWED